MTDRLLLDAMLGKLARYLRMCGHDVAYAPERGVEADEEILALAERENRRLLTRDRSMAATSEDVLLLESTAIEDQLRAVRAAGIDLELTEPSRCSSCNGDLERVEPDEVTPADTPNPGEQTVWRCRACGQRYWRGSHWDDVAERLDGL